MPGNRHPGTEAACLLASFTCFYLLASEIVTRRAETPQGVRVRPLGRTRVRPRRGDAHACLLLVCFFRPSWRSCAMGCAGTRWLETRLAAGIRCACLPALSCVPCGAGRRTSLSAAIVRGDGACMRPSGAGATWEWPTRGSRSRSCRPGWRDRRAGRSPAAISVVCQADGAGRKHRMRGGPWASDLARGAGVSCGGRLDRTGPSLGQVRRACGAVQDKRRLRLGRGRRAGCLARTCRTRRTWCCSRPCGQGGP